MPPTAQKSQAEVRQDLAKQIKQEEKTLEKLQDARAAAHAVHETAAQAYRDTQKELLLYKDQEREAMSAYQKALEAESALQGKINQLKGYLQSSAAVESGGVARG